MAKYKLFTLEFYKKCNDCLVECSKIDLCHRFFDYDSFIIMPKDYSADMFYED